MLLSAGKKKKHASCPPGSFPFPLKHQHAPATTDVFTAESRRGGWAGTSCRNPSRGVWPPPFHGLGCRAKAGAAFTCSQLQPLSGFFCPLGSDHFLSFCWKIERYGQVQTEAAWPSPARRGWTSAALPTASRLWIHAGPPASQSRPPPSSSSSTPPLQGF